MNRLSAIPYVAALLVLAPPTASASALAFEAEVHDSKPSPACRNFANDHIGKMKLVFQAINQTERAQDEAFMATISSIASPNMVRYDLTGNLPGIRGHDGAQDFIGALKAGFSDLKLVIEDIFGDCEYVTIRFTTIGTNDGEFLGFPATNKSIHVNNINIYRFDDGQVAETWQLYDALSLARQLDLPLQTIEPQYD